jgi:hypothetical protein
MTDEPDPDNAGEGRKEISQKGRPSPGGFLF